MKKDWRTDKNSGQTTLFETGHETGELIYLEKLKARDSRAVKQNIFSVIFLSFVSPRLV